MARCEDLPIISSIDFGNERLKVFHEEGEMHFQRAALEPTPTAHGEIRWLPHLGDAKHAWDARNHNRAIAHDAPANHDARVKHCGPFRSTLFRYPGKGGWTFAPIPKRLAPPVTRPWGRTPVRAVVDGISWETSVWRDSKSEGSLLAVPARIRGAKGNGDTVTVELTFEDDD